MNYMQAFEQQVFEAGAPPEQESMSDPWEGQIFSLKDAFKPRDPLLFIINGLWPEGSLSIVYGAPGTLKSMILGHAAVCVAAGVSFLGREVRQSPVLWIDLDNGKRRSHERFEALARGIGADEGVPFYYMSMPTPWLNAGNPSDIKLLAERIRERGAKLVIIDNLGLVSPGADENSDQMIQIMANLRLLAEETGAAIILIHHQRKSSGNNTRAGETLRGHSSIEGALDLALLVEREEGSPAVQIRSTKTRDVDVPLFAAEFLYEHRPGTDELWAVGFRKVEIQDDSSPAAIEKALLGIIEEHPRLTQTEVVNFAKSELQAGEKLIRRTLKEMVRKKEIKTEAGLRGAILHVLN